MIGFIRLVLSLETAAAAPCSHAFWRRAVGFTSLISKGAWLVEFGIDECLLPDLANRAWKNNLRLLSTHRTVVVSEVGRRTPRFLESRLLRLPKRSGWLPQDSPRLGALRRKPRTL